MTIRERVRLYPTRRQAERLAMLLDVTRQLYNTALEQRRDAWRTRRISITEKRQGHELTELRAADQRVKAVYRELEDAALHRLELAMRAFFRGAGFPRFRAAARWNTLEFPHGDRALRVDDRQRKVSVPGIGTVALRRGRMLVLEGLGRAMITRRNGRWWLTLECDVPDRPLPANGHTIGVDRGVTSLVATSDGDVVAAPRFAAAAAHTIARCQRVVERRSTRDAGGRLLGQQSRRRKAAVRALAIAHEKVANARRDFAHKLSRELINRADLIALEKLRVRNMTRSAGGNMKSPGKNVRQKARLNAGILDAAWTTLKTLIYEKAASAARRIVEVDARNTSRECSRCGHIAGENRRGQLFECVRCGHRAHADVDAAIVILKRAESLPAASRAR